MNNPSLMGTGKNRIQYQSVEPASPPTSFLDILACPSTAPIYILQAWAVFRIVPADFTDAYLSIMDKNHTTTFDVLDQIALDSIIGQTTILGVPVTISTRNTARLEWRTPNPPYGYKLIPNQVLCLHGDSTKVVWAGGGGVFLS